MFRWVSFCLYQELVVRSSVSWWLVVDPRSLFVLTKPFRSRSSSSHPSLFLLNCMLYGIFNYLSYILIRLSSIFHSEYTHSKQKHRPLKSFELNPLPERSLVKLKTLLVFFVGLFHCHCVRVVLFLRHWKCGNFFRLYRWDEGHGYETGVASLDYSNWNNRETKGKTVWKIENIYFWVETKQNSGKIHEASPRLFSFVWLTLFPMRNALRDVLWA